MTALDLDTWPVAITGIRLRTWRPNATAVAGALAVLCALLAGVLLARPEATSPTGARPTLQVSAESLPLTLGQDPGAFFPTVTAYATDGTQIEAAAALTGPWRPDRPIRMVTVVASLSCSIEVDGQLVTSRGAAPNRVAECVWTAA